MIIKTNDLLKFCALAQKVSQCFCSTTDCVTMFAFRQLLYQMNRKQVPLCKSCHLQVHSGRYDGKSFKSKSKE